MQGKAQAEHRNRTSSVKPFPKGPGGPGGPGGPCGPAAPMGPIAPGKPSVPGTPGSPYEGQNIHNKLGHDGLPRLYPMNLGGSVEGTFLVK